MYHLNNTRRSRQTVELILDAIWQLSQKKLLEEMTVSEVLRLSTVSRSTFYRNFDYLSDVLQYKADQGFIEMWTQFAEKYKDVAPPRDALVRNTHEYWEKEKKFLEIISKNQRSDFLYRAVINNIHVFADIYLPQVERNTRLYRYWASDRAGVLSSNLLMWAQNGMKETPRQIAEFTEQYKDFMDAAGFMIR